MAISERIHFFRTKNNMTMKELGNRLGFSEKTADVRIAQYETAKRLPKADTAEKLETYLNRYDIEFEENTNKVPQNSSPVNENLTHQNSGIMDSSFNEDSNLFKESSLCLISNTFATASGLVASHPIPQTVSGG